MSTTTDAQLYIKYARRADWSYRIFLLMSGVAIALAIVGVSLWLLLAPVTVMAISALVCHVNVQRRLRAQVRMIRAGTYSSFPRSLP